MGRLIWLASYPKSGNTWVRAFLANLLGDSGRPADINRLGGSLSQGESALGWYRILDARPVERWTGADIARLRPRVHALIAGTAEGTSFCKTHNALTEVRGQPTVNMAVSAGAVYIVRNPLDVTLSFADFQNVSIDRAIEMMATRDFETPMGERNVPDRLGSWSQHVASWTGGGHRRLHLLRYEDMLEAPLDSFRELAGFLDLKAPRARLTRAIRNASFDVLRRQEARSGFHERAPHQQRFFRKGRAGQWKSELDADQVERVCAHHGRQMARFGYLPRRAARAAPGAAGS